MEQNQSEAITLFIKSLEALDIELNENQLSQFMDYYELLVEWNKVMNLTSITELTQVIQKHFVDSLSIVKVCKPTKERILDLGTGAGFPGIPLKIVFPQLDIVLLDSLKKRLNFLDEVINKLKLQNIRTLHGRAEDYGRDKAYREAFDMCVSRAVAKLSVLSEYCVPYVKQGGLFIAYKSGDILEELKFSDSALKQLGAKVEEVNSFILPYSDIERSLIVVRKTKGTPMRFPRSAGKPVKEPL